MYTAKVNSEQTDGAVVWLPRGLPQTFQVRSETARVFQVSTPEEIDPAHMAEVCQSTSRTRPRAVS